MTNKNSDTGSSLLRDLLPVHESADDVNGLPVAVIKQLRTKIRKGANDIEQVWDNAVELTHKAFEVIQVRRPLPQHKAAWRDYVGLIQYAVVQLRETRGPQATWRVSDAITPDVPPISLPDPS